MSKRLYRSRSERKIGGVCGGLSEYFDVDPVFIRALFVITTLGYGIGFIAYIVLWIIVPERSKIYVDDTNEVFVENPEEVIEEEPLKSNSNRKVVFGVILIIVGMLLFIDEFIPALEIEYIFPIILISLGVYIIGFKSFKSRKEDVSKGVSDEY